MKNLEPQKTTVQEFCEVMDDFYAGKFGRGNGMTNRQIFQKAKRLDILEKLTEADVDELVRLKYETGMSAWVLKNQIRERNAKKTQ